MPKSVLIIDDSEPIHKLISAFLQPDGPAIHSAYDGEAGVAAALLLQPGLILLDIDLPGIDGFDVCSRLKARPETAAIPIIFLTASSDIQDRLKGLDIGALDYLSKPFKPLELRARVRAALHMKNQPQIVSPMTVPD